MSKVIGCVHCERDIEREHDDDCPNHPDNLGHTRPLPGYVGSASPPTGEPQPENCICKETSRIPGYQLTVKHVPDCPVHRQRWLCDDCGKEECLCDAARSPTLAPDGTIKFVAALPDQTGEAQPVTDECSRCGAAVCRGAKLRMLCEDCVPPPPMKFWKDGEESPTGEPTILSDDDVNSVAWSAEVGDHMVGGVKIVALCASHRLLAARVKELEKEHPRHRVIHD